MSTWSFMFDFDGTISPADMGHVIFNAFADQSWRDIDEEWIQGHIPTSERARRQFELVQVGEQEFLALIDQHKVDPDFFALVAFLRENGIEVQVVSDGFDVYVGRMLNTAGLGDLPFTSNVLRFRGDEIVLEFPHERAGHDPRGGWKGEAVRNVQATGCKVAYVGDGMSDLSAARAADLLFACGRLAQCCEQEGLPHHVFAGMRDVHDWLQVNTVATSR